MSKRKHKQSKRDRCAHYLIKCILKDNRKRQYRGSSLFDIMTMFPPLHPKLITAAEMDELIEKMFHSGEMEML